MLALTYSFMAVMIAPLSVGKLSGIGTPLIRGAKTPTKGVFLCLSFLYAATCAYSLWRRYLGSFTAGRSTGGSSNPLNAAAQKLGTFKQRFTFLHRGVSAMINQSTGHQSAQTQPKTALFSITWHRQIVCQNIAGALAMRFKRRHPEVIVKFQGFEGGAL